MKMAMKLIGLVLALSCAFPVMAGGKPAMTRQSSATLLTEAEEATLLWMREEEKLARDVYLTLYKLWNKPVFAEIAESEQAHMDALLKKIELFGLIDPVLPEVGSFSNPDLQSLYDELIARGQLSYVEALAVGAAIEDMDIRDIGNAIAETANLSLKTTYESLLEGSKNHLRAFVDLLDQQGVEYSPQFIDQAVFDAILAV
ncbi:MAG: DUF2202 domain-containing protein [Methylomonas sp.]|jgi:hypothetical protein|uniref:DUF2202 domain-containing protein n=1 Tax=Methylomonas sp. TaxID=418 RepID=UPI0025E85C93|nr:DUF2202 domain-containing protein [Methylomonas sp.]MCK9606338.1 DUF2202 domain-containing protein [Methylomonas sp.]